MWAPRLNLGAGPIFLMRRVTLIAGALIAGCAPGGAQPLVDARACSLAAQYPTLAIEGSLANQPAAVAVTLEALPADRPVEARQGFDVDLPPGWRLSQGLLSREESNEAGTAVVRLQLPAAGAGGQVAFATPPPGQSPDTVEVELEVTFATEDPTVPRAVRFSGQALGVRACD